MTQRITRAHLDAKVATLNSMTKSPAEPYRTVDGKAVANKGNYHISGAYGGYCLHRMATEGGGVSDVFSTGHISARELAGLMSAYMAGLYDATRGNTMTDIYTTPIKTEADAEGFFYQLHQLGRLFHPEDDPANVGIFTPEQCQHLRERLDEVYEVMNDPCDYCLTLTHPDSDRDDDHGLSHADLAQFYGPSAR